jgi:hypothetical protein
MTTLISDIDIQAREDVVGQYVAYTGEGWKILSPRQGLTVAPSSFSGAIAPQPPETIAAARGWALIDR